MSPNAIQNIFVFPHWNSNTLSKTPKLFSRSHRETQTHIYSEIIKIISDPHTRPQPYIAKHPWHFKSAWKVSDPYKHLEASLIDLMELTSGYSGIGLSRKETNCTFKQGHLSSLLPTPSPQNSKIKTKQKQNVDMHLFTMSTISSLQHMVYSSPSCALVSPTDMSLWYTCTYVFDTGMSFHSVFSLSLALICRNVPFS